jgi:hypothetical protein
MKTAKLKSKSKLKQLIKQGQVRLIHVSDCGEWITYGVPDGGFTHLLHVHVEDHSQEYQVTKLENSISESSLERLNILFE